MVTVNNYYNNIPVGRDLNNLPNTSSTGTTVGYQYDGLTEEDRFVQKVLQEHYDKVYKENLSHSDPMAYIESKYCDVTSPNFCSYMTEDQRSIAYRNEKRMLQTGGKYSAGFARYDYALRNYKDNPIYNKKVGDIMNIFFNSRINANQSLLNVLFGQQQKAASSQNTGCRGTRDTLTISASGKEKLTKSTSGRTHNTSIDSSIDLKSYIASAKKTNQELIENAGTQINAKTSEYMSTGKAFRAALTEKYSKLAAEAKTHSNPENYIHSKYFDKSSEYYETNLTDTERRIAYNYEMQMCRTGKINGVNYQDSLFRGIEVDGDSVDSDKIQFERALVNSQISNILKQAGVDTSSITKDCTFTVDPYSYEITVDGVDEETKVLMQNALNVGNNGKNLYKHIYYCSTQDGCESSQVTEESKMKYEAYHQVYSYTGYELDKLEEKNGTYYTESGENILDLVDSAVESSGKVPKEFKQQMKNWIHDLVSTISTRGWNNVPDMTLSILYGKSGLKDMNQLITYQYEADRMNRQWYSVL